jgi:hypothetical protein
MAPLEKVVQLKNFKL